MRIVYQIISWVFMPLLMPIYTLLILFNLEAISVTAISMKDNLYFSTFAFKWIVFSVFFILVVAAPGLSLIMMRRRNKITSVELDNKDERYFPILITGFYSLLLFLILYKQLPPIYFSFIIHGIAILGVVSSLFALLISKFTKISLHALGASLMAGTLIYYYSFFYVPNLLVLMGAILLGGIIMFARLRLEKHTLRQVIAGYILGLVVSLTTFPIVNYFV